MSEQNTKTNNPFKAWKNKRDARKKALAEQAAMEITNDTAENEMKIVNVLDSVDFNRSRLPEDVLAFKSKEDHPCGDLEYAVRAISSYIKKNPQGMLLDIRKIDEKILELAYIFRDAVKDGETTTAIESKNALVRGVREIRPNVPSDIKENAKLYVDTYVKYLDTCITYCELARVTDRLRDTALRDKEILDADEARYQEINDEFAQKIKEDPELATAFSKIIEVTDVKDRIKWSDIERDLHLEMVNKRMQGVTLELKKLKYQQDLMSESTANARLEALSIRVQTLPIVVDPNQMNKFQEQIDLLFEEFAKADLEIDESLRSIDDIEGRIEQLNSAPGAVRAREIASEEARKTLEDIKKQQDSELAKTRSKKDEALRRLGIRTDEEQAKLKAELEAQQTAVVEEMMEADISDSNIILN